MAAEKTLIPTLEKPNRVRARRIRMLLFSLGVFFALLSLYNIGRIFAGVYDVDFKAFDLAIKSLLTPGDTPYQPHQGEQSFHYPLWTSFLYLPIAPFPHAVANQIWVSLGMLLLAPVVWLLRRVYLPSWSPATLPFLYCMALFLSAPSLFDGFPIVLLTTFFALMLYALQTGKPVQAGVWGALGLMMKPQLTFLVALSLVAWLFLGTAEARQTARRWWLGAIGGGIVVFLLSLAAKPDWIPQLIHALSTESLTERVLPDGTLEVWVTTTFPDWVNYLTGLSGGPLTILYIIFWVVILGLTCYRLPIWRNSPALWVALALVINVVLTPYARPYDYPFLIPALFAALSFGWQAYRQGRLGAALLLFGGVGLVFLMTAINRDFRWFYFQPLILTILLLAVPTGLTVSPDLPQTTKPAAQLT